MMKVTEAGHLLTLKGHLNRLVQCRWVHVDDKSERKDNGDGGSHNGGEVSSRGGDKRVTL